LHAHGLAAEGFEVSCVFASRDLSQLTRTPLRLGATAILKRHEALRLRSESACRLRWLFMQPHDPSTQMLHFRSINDASKLRLRCSELTTFRALPPLRWIRRPIPLTEHRSGKLFERVTKDLHCRTRTGIFAVGVIHV
jgi:hypothetical protein